MAIVAGSCSIKNLEVWQRGGGQVATCKYADRKSGVESTFTVGVKEVDGKWYVCSYAP
jgi:hypothetical protein